MARSAHRFMLVAALLCPLTVLAGEVSTGGMTHRMMLLVIQLGLLLFATRLGNMLFERLRLPGVLGELFAGMLIGPHLLGAVSLPGFAHGLFPAGPGFPVSPELYGFCSVAAIVLLFVVGLETDLEMFVRYSVAGSAVGIGGAVLSFVTGDVLAVLFGQAVFGRPVGFTDPAALFLGIVSTATSVGITARILSEKRALDSPEGVTILAGAVIDDVLGIIMLTVVLGVASASKATGRVDWVHVSVIGAKAVGIWLAATLMGILASRRIGALLKLFRDHGSIATMALGLALILSGLFEEAGLAMIIGAYVMGLSLSRTDIAQLIQERLAPVYTFLVPVFFGVMGMMVDFRALSAGPVLVFGLAYSAVAVFAKVIGSGVPALCFNFNLLGALRVGTGMVPRGEVALIVAGIGLAAGALAPDVFGVAVLMTVITTVAAPPLLVLLFARERSGLRIAQEAPDERALTFELPSTTMTEWAVERLVKAFRAEGCFVHRLQHERGLIQVRHEDTAFTFSWEGANLLFECPPRDEPFVRTALLEVLGDLRRTIEGLQHVVDLGAVVAGPVAGGAAPARILTQYLDAGAMIPALRGTTKTEIIDELLARLVERGGVSDRERARRDLLARERSLSTGLSHGLAAPHARTDAVDRLAAVVGLKPDGVSFDSLDGQLARVIVLTLSPTSQPAPHLQFMAAISQALTSERCRFLADARTPQEMLAVLTASGAARWDAAGKVSKRARPRSDAELQLDAYLRPEAVVQGLRATTKWEAIDELVERLCDTGLLAAQDAPDIREALNRREHQMSTGLEKGIAVPHCRTERVDDFLCAIGLKPEGLDFESLDGKPTRLILLAISPEHGNIPAIQFMSALVQGMNQLDLDELLNLSSAEEVVERILGTG